MTLDRPLRTIKRLLPALLRICSKGLVPCITLQPQVTAPRRREGSRCLLTSELLHQPISIYTVTPLSLASPRTGASSLTTSESWRLRGGAGWTSRAATHLPGANQTLNQGPDRYGETCQVVCQLGNPLLTERALSVHSSASPTDTHLSQFPSPSSGQRHEKKRKKRIGDTGR